MRRLPLLLLHVNVNQQQPAEGAAQSAQSAQQQQQGFVLLFTRSALPAAAAAAAAAGEKRPDSSSGGGGSGGDSGGGSGILLVAWCRETIPIMGVVSAAEIVSSLSALGDSDTSSAAAAAGPGARVGGVTVPQRWNSTGVLGARLPDVHYNDVNAAGAGGRLELMLTSSPVYLRPVMPPV